MSRFESSVKQVPYRQQSVFDMLSDLSNAERVKHLVNDDQLQNMSFDNDHISVNVPPIGKIALRIVEREDPKCVKYQ